MAEDIDLDKIMLSAETVEAWHAMAERIALALAQLQAAGKNVPEIPIERGRIEEDGTLTVYVRVPDVLNISMSVPADHWSRRQ